MLQVPSLQMRKSTERPQVYDVGSSVKFDPAEPEKYPAAEYSESWSRSWQDVDSHAGRRPVVRAHRRGSAPTDRGRTTFSGTSPSTITCRQRDRSEAMESRDVCPRRSRSGALARRRARRPSTRERQASAAQAGCIRSARCSDRCAGASCLPLLPDATAGQSRSGPVCLCWHTGRPVCQQAQVPQTQAVVPGERRKYIFDGIVEDITILRVDPTDETAESQEIVYHVAICPWLSRLRTT